MGQEWKKKSLRLKDYPQTRHVSAASGQANVRDHPSQMTTVSSACPRDNFHAPLPIRRQGAEASRHSDTRGRDLYDLLRLQNVGIVTLDRPEYYPAVGPIAQ